MMKKLKGSFYLTGNNNLGVLVCHGLKGDPSQMRELGEYINQLGYTVSCPEFRGHGTDEENFANTTVKE